MVSPSLTHKVTSVPFVRLVFARGEVFTTLPSSISSEAIFCCSLATVNPASCKVLMASSTVYPETSGTKISLLTVKAGISTTKVVMATTNKVKIEARIINNLFCFFKSFLVICLANTSSLLSTGFSFFFFSFEFSFFSSVFSFLTVFFVSSENSL